MQSEWCTAHRPAQSCSPPPQGADAMHSMPTGSVVIADLNLWKPDTTHSMPTCTFAVGERLQVDVNGVCCDQASILAQLLHPVDDLTSHPLLHQRVVRPAKQQFYNVCS